MHENEEKGLVKKQGEMEGEAHFLFAKGRMQNVMACIRLIMDR
jgi:hypothetical protein